MFQGAADEVVERAREEGDDDLLTQGGTALEVRLEWDSADCRWRSSVDQRGLFGVLLVRKLLVSWHALDLYELTIRGDMVWEDHLHRSEC
jgi:hypothetical protein